MMSPRPDLSYSRRTKKFQNVEAMQAKDLEPKIKFKQKIFKKIKITAIARKAIVSIDIYINRLRLGQTIQEWLCGVHLLLNFLDETLYFLFPFFPILTHVWVVLPKPSY